MEFTICDSTNSPGIVMAGPLANLATSVSNGLFTVPLDFGNIFDGNGRWLEITMQKNGGGFITLAPRQQLTPAPYAIFANTASNVSGTISTTQLSGSLPLAQLPAEVITNGASGVMFSGVLARGGPPGPGGVNNNGYAFSGNGGDDDSGMFSSTDGQIEFYNDANEVMRITQGQVGIGTTNPAGILDVEGAGGSAAPIILTAGSGVPAPTEGFGGGNGANVIITGGVGGFGDDFIGGSGGNLILTGGTGGSVYQFAAGGSGGNIILLPGAGGTSTSGGGAGKPGNVGIGTSSPISRLNVVGTGGSGQGLQFDNKEIKFRGDGDAHWSIFANRIPGTLTIEDTSLDAVSGVPGIVAITVEKTTGHVGIGTTSPGKLLVRCNI